MVGFLTLKYWKSTDRYIGKHTPNTVIETLNTGKLETPNQTLNDNDHQHKEANSDPRRKNECRNHEKNHVWKENSIVFWSTVKSETEKVNVLLTNTPTNITELNDLIYAGAKLICEKSQRSPEDHKQKVKTQIKITDKILRQQAKAQKKEYEDIFGRRGKTIRTKNTSQRD